MYYRKIKFYISLTKRRGHYLVEAERKHVIHRFTTTDSEVFDMFHEGSYQKKHLAAACMYSKLQMLLEGNELIGSFGLTTITK